MKSKHDIHVCMAGMTMLAHDQTITELERKVAISAMQMLCWVMDYPTTFDDTFAAIKNHFGHDQEHLDKIIKEAFEEGFTTTTTTTTVIKLSICQCGFPLFTEDVKLGDEYEVDRALTIPNSSVSCGGCKLDIPSTFIWTEAKGYREAGWMPMEVFDL